MLAKPGLLFESRIATAILILGNYIKLLFVPYPLICDYSYNTISFVSFNHIGVLFSLAIYILLMEFSIRKFLKNKRDPFAFSVLFFLITISLFSNIPFLIGATMGERLLFFPSVGFCLFVPLAIEKCLVRSELTYPSGFKNPYLIAILLPVSIIFIFLTTTRNTDWKDNDTLFHADLKKALKNSRLNCYYGREIVKNAMDTEKDPAKQRQLIIEGISYMKNAIKIFPDYRDAYSNTGYAYFTIMNYDSAEVYLLKAFQLNPNGIDQIKNLALLYFFKKNYTKAIELFKDEIALSPGNVEPYSNIGTCYQNSGRVDSAIYYFKMAISVDPKYTKAYENLAITYNSIGMPDSAKKYQIISHKNR